MARLLGRREFLAGLAPWAAPSGLFEEIPSSRSGIRWVHDNAKSAERYLPETLGPGVAFVDYDNDGWPDIFLVNSGRCDFYRPAVNSRNALYHNNRDGTFTDVTAKSGVAGGDAFGMGVAAGDYNNDGYPDLFVTAYGRPTLYRNNGNGTFTDVTEKAGLSAPGWTTSAAWFDYNGDGLLDLIVCGFVDYTRESQGLCTESRGGKPGYCIPRMFNPTSCKLYRNLGDGTFRDVSVETGLSGRASKALGVVATDVNNDGRMDLFIANDTLENFLLLNRGERGWEDAGIPALVGLGADGNARSGMGVDAADIDGDGWQDLFVSNIDKEMFTLYRNTGFGIFDDLSFASEIGTSTYYMSGWGARLFDLDNDGAPELMVANGHPDDLVAERASRVRYREPLLLFQRRDKQWRNISAQGGPAFERDYAARGLATGDFDNNGRLDALVGINGGSPLLLKNNAGKSNHWVGARLRGVKANRDAVGAHLTWRAGGVSRSRLKTGGGSYLSAHDPREVLGLGTAARLDWVEVRWPAPSGRRERFHGLATGRYSTLVEGEGSPVNSPG